MKIMTAVLGVASLALAGGLAVVAQVHGGSGGHGPHGAEGPLAVPHMLEWLVDHSLNDVGASDAQRTKVLAVKDRVMSEAQVLHTGHEATHAEFRHQWELAKMDTARLHALVDARMVELGQVLHTAVNGIVEVHDTLTPEQRRTLTAKVQAMHGTE